jgi:hypothetical protein
MIDQTNSDSESPIEPDVRIAYRRSAVESTPESLNRQILQLARQALADRPIAPRAESWIRPLAFAAMVVLSLAAILQFQDAGLVEVAPGLQSDSADGRPAYVEHGAGDLQQRWNRPDSGYDN